MLVIKIGLTSDFANKTQILTSDKMLAFDTVIAFLISSRAAFSTRTASVLPRLGPESQETSWVLSLPPVNYEWQCSLRYITTAEVRFV
jgi:hypothetical protein